MGTKCGNIITLGTQTNLLQQDKDLRQEHLMPCEQRNIQLEELNLLILFLVTVMMVAKGPKEQGCEQKLIYFPQGNLGQLGPKAVSAAAASEYWKAK
ncbi:hypothetical protein H112_07890 [Trichophyton rubrum D6]|uniref:Uncharacterized protein n=2 Tax=Trichophyton TaxID=5550 RepID=A0A022VQS7_TRIRU|nr:hypothetical protein H100_07917 [Trichophyton rubrum MR850]EZF37856.1 hypothetical protein H102_07877 [Trichophyton rubrum CBS 100081]EZF48420.1 hypothetical protein H103_07902 [Trichophyton rubrum CBS 288.86]EZF59116.1 hypothetical protein H104_07849 [Trichophyton rubrum CBS 289.86]EZF69673.1 hypothetical protein H105_07903 [Trichophyton soudanense CBS 452.61]EZF80379.1 hypothetical protein H110_07901 [Trichophyton rubrum MR1448]EZF90998.1 hypothetical protein H113_07963 [Trichophyton rub